MLLLLLLLEHQLLALLMLLLLLLPLFETVEHFTLSRELVFGEHDLCNRGQDCDNNSGNNFCLPLPTRREPAEIIVHEDWDPRRFALGNDIALIR